MVHRSVKLPKAIACQLTSVSLDNLDISPYPTTTQGSGPAWDAIPCPWEAALPPGALGAMTAA